MTKPFVLLFASMLAACGSSVPPPGSKSGAVTELDPHRSSGFLAGAADDTGRLLAAGYFIDDDRTQGRILIARFAPDGSLDLAYGSGGMTHVAVPGEVYAVAQDAIVDSSQRAVACGTGYSTETDEEGERIASTAAVLVRLDAQGMPDAAFGDAGVARLPPQVGLQNGCFGVRQAGGYYYMLGANQPPRGLSDVAPLPLAPLRPTRFYGFVVRFDETGMLDSSFGEAGVYEIPDDYSSALLRQDRAGRLYLVSSALHSADAGSDLVVRRFLPDGQPDATYGEAGRAIVPAPEGIYFGAQDADVDGVGRLRLVGGQFIVDPDSESGGHLRPMTWQLSESGQVDDVALRRVIDAYRSFMPAFFHGYAQGDTRAYSVLVHESRPHEVVGLRATGLIDPGYRPFAPAIETYRLTLLGGRPVSLGLVVREVDGESNAAAAIEFLPR